MYAVSTSYGWLKLQEWTWTDNEKGGRTFQEWTMAGDIAGVDFTGVDNKGGNRRRWTMMEWITSR